LCRIVILMIEDRYMAVEGVMGKVITTNSIPVFNLIKDSHHRFLAPSYNFYIQKEALDRDIHASK
jgi:hypothetical protein